MAAPGYVLGLINGIPDETTRNALTGVFNYLMRYQTLGNSPKATNFGWYRITGTTAAIAGVEFSVTHGLGIAPTKVIPILVLDAVGNSLVPLTMSRVPDASRLYFTSTIANATWTAFVE